MKTRSKILTVLGVLALGGGLLLALQESQGQGTPPPPADNQFAADEPPAVVPPAEAVPPAPGAAAGQIPPPPQRPLTNVTLPPLPVATPAATNAPVRRQLPGRVGGAPPQPPPFQPRSAPGAAPAVTQPGPTIPPATPATASPAGTVPALPEGTTAAGAIPPSATSESGVGVDGKYAPGMITLQMADIEQVLALYASITKRTVLRPTQTLPKAQIMLNNETPWTPEEAVQALDTVLAMNGISMINVDDKFVSAVPNTTVLTAGAAFTKRDPKDLSEMGQFVTKVVKLKHALPSEVQQLVGSFAQVANGIVAIDSTQTLVLRDYPANVKRMCEIIEQVDVEVENDYKLEVIPIRFGKVDDIYDTMSSLIGGGGAVGTAAGGGAVARTTGMGRGARGARGSSRFGGFGGTSGMGGYGGYGGSGYGGTGGYRSGGYYPQQMVATPVSPVRPATPGSTFNQQFQRILNRAGQQAQPVQLLQDAKIVPDERANSLIVFASKTDMKMITNVVAKVDTLQAQVLIEAIIMDVSLSDDYSLGVSLLMHPQQTGNLTSVAASQNGQSFISSLTNFTSGSGGLTYLARYNNDMDVAVQALAANNRGQVLARPRIQTTHATPASFEVGQSVPYVTSTYYGGSTYGPSSSFQQLDVTTSLDVTPFITPDGLVVMDIDQNIEDISGYQEFAGVGKMPLTTRRSASATVAVRDRETIILGGYIRTSKTKNSSGIPLLKDIPGLGVLFRNKSSNQVRNEMMVLIRPTILETPTAASAEADLQRQRLPGIKDMERDFEQGSEKLNEKLNTLFGK